MFNWKNDSYNLDCQILTLHPLSLEYEKNIFITCISFWTLSPRRYLNKRVLSLQLDVEKEGVQYICFHFDNILKVINIKSIYALSRKGNVPCNIDFKLCFLSATCILFKCSWKTAWTDSDWEQCHRLQLRDTVFQIPQPVFDRNWSGGSIHSVSSSGMNCEIIRICVGSGYVDFWVFFSPTNLNSQQIRIHCFNSLIIVENARNYIPKLVKSW